MDHTAIFERVEMKYVLTAQQYEQLMNMISCYLRPDEYPHSEITSIYFDTDSYQLIRSADDHQAYREKLRLRSYNGSSITDDSPVFLELKKKYNGVIYKRRQEMTYRQARQYILFGTMPCDSQIMKEIDYTRRSCHTLEPKAVISYHRDSYAGISDDIRMTFDTSIGYNTSKLVLAGSRPQGYITNGEVIMEVKAFSTMPLWLSAALDSLHVYPGSFSKYGKVYQQHIMKGAQTCSNYCLHPYSHPHLTAPLSSFAQ